MPDKPPNNPVVNVYIDGYNVYRPIQLKAEEGRDPKVLHLAWCDYLKLAGLLAAREFGQHRLGAIKLFTAYARDEVKSIMRSDGLKRKEAWLEALRIATKGRVHISFGRWEMKGPDHPQPKEKLTDVKLAISLVRDGLLRPVRDGIPKPWSFQPEHKFEDDDPAWPFDKALVVSCDKDFLPAAEMVARESRREVRIAFPYLSTPYHLPPGALVKTTQITADDLRASSLPDIIYRPDGSMISWSDYVISKGWSTRATLRAGGH